MIIMDTCALIFDALTPERLSRAAKKTIDIAEHQKKLACCDISLWEIAMLVEKRRLNPGTDVQNFLQLLLKARFIQVLPINSAIASISCSSIFHNYDPADRLVAATTIHHHAKLITCDEKIRNINSLEIIW
jgi:PIN domain nuclease of toxin-antitoxin system